MMAWDRELHIQSEESSDETPPSSGRRCYCPRLFSHCVRGTPYSNLFFIIFPYFSLFFYIFPVIISPFYRFYLISPSFFPRLIRFSHTYVISLCTIFLYIYLYLFIFLRTLQRNYIIVTSFRSLFVTYRCPGRGGVPRAFSLDSFLPRYVSLQYLLFYVINFGFFLA